MKKTILISMGIITLFALGFRTLDGRTIVPGYTATPGARWDTINDEGTADTITATQATFAVTARDYSTVWTDLPDANTITWNVPQDASGIELRFQTTADADAQVIEMWVATGDYYRNGTSEEQFMLGAVFTLTGGTQTAPNSNVFCDTMSVVEHMIDDGEVRSGSGNNRVAVYKVDLRGYKKVIFIATTFEAASTIYIDSRWY